LAAKKTRFYRFDGTDYIEVEEAKVPDQVKEHASKLSAVSFSEDGGSAGESFMCGLRNIRQEATPYITDGRVDLDKFEWRYDDGVVYYQGRQIATMDSIMEQLGQTLENVHSRSVVGIDLRPGNVLIDKKGNANLIDFDISYSTRLYRWTKFYKALHEADHKDLAEIFDDDHDKKSHTELVYDEFN